MPKNYLKYDIYCGEAGDKPDCAFASKNLDDAISIADSWTCQGDYMLIIDTYTNEVAYYATK